MSVKKAYAAGFILVATLVVYTFLFINGIDLFWLFALIVVISGGYIGAVIAARRTGFEGPGESAGSLGQKSGQSDTRKK